MKRVTAIFDIGKTNKKLLLFDEDYKVVYECVEQLPETSDEDGFPCEDISFLQKWIKDRWKDVLALKDFTITGLNFTSYGASMVHLDKDNNPVTPIYNYLKPYPTGLAEKLYEQYGGKWSFAVSAYSPPLGMLNSGLQLYWLKNKKPEVFQKITTTLHLPQYLSYLFTGRKASELTSIGCHTGLWDFSAMNYLPWVKEEKMLPLLPTMNSKESSLIINGTEMMIGNGLHDSSSALIPYLQNFKEPFLLLSTGTWCITFNPFNNSPLTQVELSKDCLCYLSAEGNPVKASRIFLGKEYEYQTSRLTEYFGKDNSYFSSLQFDNKKLNALLENNNHKRMLIPACMDGTGPLPEKSDREWNLHQFKSAEDAYLQLLLDLTCMLKYSIELVNTSNTKILFAEGGFGNNELFMNLLANHFPDKTIKASHVQQATALGAAMHLNKSVGMITWHFESYKTSSITFSLENYYKSLVEEMLLDKAI